jgi:hypothetical protein
VTVFQFYFRIFIFIQLIEFCWALRIVFFVGKVRRRDGENTGITKEKELFVVTVNLFPSEPRDIYHSAVLEQVNVLVQFL